MKAIIQRVTGASVKGLCIYIYIYHNYEDKQKRR